MHKRRENIGFFKYIVDSVKFISDAFNRCKVRHEKADNTLAQFYKFVS